MSKLTIPCRLVACFLGALLANPGVAAPVSSAFACSTEEPYANMFVEQLPDGKVRLGKVNGTRRDTIAVRTGTLNPGQSLHSMTSGDVLAVPLVRDGSPVVDLVLHGRVAGSWPGQFHGLVASPSGKSLLTVTTAEGMGRQVLIDPEGKILGERPLKLHLEEGHGLAFRFTGAGDALYVRPDANSGASTIEVLSADGRFDKVFEARLDGVMFRDVVMVEPERGFAIGGSQGGSQLFQIDKRGFRSLGRKGDNYRPESIEVDFRAGGLLVSGSGGYVLHDIDGNRVAARFGYASRGRPYAPSVRLALDGSIAEYRRDGTVSFREARSGYRDGVGHKLDLRAWNAAQCLTTRSIAFRQPDGRLATKVFD